MWAESPRDTWAQPQDQSSPSLSVPQRVCGNIATSSHSSKTQVPHWFQPSALPTPTLWWMGRRTRDSQVLKHSNHSYLQQGNPHSPRFAPEPSGGRGLASREPSEMDWQQGQRPPEACLQSVPSDPEVWGLGEGSSHMKIPNIHSWRHHPMVGSPQEAKVPELGNPLGPCPRKQCSAASTSKCGAAEWGTERVTSRAVGISEEDQPWPLCLFASMVEILNTKGVIQITFVQLKYRNSGAKNNNYTLVPRNLKILKA